MSTFLMACLYLAPATALAAIYCAARARRKPEPKPPTSLRDAVDGNWEPTDQGRVWRGATFVRPKRGRS